jgi:hypothetical protein
MGRPVVVAHDRAVWLPGGPRFPTPAAALRSVGPLDAVVWGRLPDGIEPEDVAGAGLVLSVARLEALAPAVDLGTAAQPGLLVQRLREAQLAYADGPPTLIRCAASR